MKNEKESFKKITPNKNRRPLDDEELSYIAGGVVETDIPLDPGLEPCPVPINPLIYGECPLCAMKNVALYYCNGTNVCSECLTQFMTPEDAAKYEASFYDGSRTW